MTTTNSSSNRPSISGYALLDEGCNAILRRLGIGSFRLKIIRRFAMSLKSVFASAVVTGLSQTNRASNFKFVVVELAHFCSRIAAPITFARKIMVMLTQ